MGISGTKKATGTYSGLSLNRISCLQRSGRGSQELPGKGLALILTGHSKQQVCVHWKLKALKHWAEVHTSAGQTLSTPHRQRTTQSLPSSSCGPQSHMSHPHTCANSGSGRSPLPNLRLSSKAPSLAGWKRAKAAIKGWRKLSAEWGRSLQCIIGEEKQHLQRAC